MRRRRYRLSEVVFSFAGWLPSVAVVFGVLLFEAYTHLSIYAYGYQEGRLKSEVKAVTARIEELKAREAESAPLEKMEERAPDLGLVNREPGQLHEVNPHAPQAPLSPEGDYAVASLSH